MTHADAVQRARYAKKIGRPPKRTGRPRGPDSWRNAR